MAAPITQGMHNWGGQIVMAWIEHTSAGAAAETISLGANMPKFDLTKSHPVISGVYIDIEGDDASGSIALLPENECARASTPDTTNGDWAIYDADTIKAYLTSDKNGILGLVYWAAGVKVL